ncbi:MAG: shikimate dehydrogenase [Renibacterium salmoninarum]|nr:shikimate dehydrogenase [Renibacterium salmoninarum]
MQLKAAVIGQPIAHSKSPALHRAAYRALGADIDYRLIEVAPADLADFVAQIRAEQNWSGISVTMPHKASMLALVDARDADVQRTGALNTVLVDPADGRLLGRNTDIIGIVHALRHAGVASVQHAALIGGGGTARAALAALKQLDCQRAVVYLRDPAKGGDLAELAAVLGLGLTLRPFAEAADPVTGAGAAELVISTLPPGAADPLAEALRGTGPGSNLLLDVAYDPWPSRLAHVWSESGGVVVSGLEMLLYQAVAQVAAFSGCDLAGREDVINVMCDSIGLPER